jgi:hypothetical protein
MPIGTAKFVSALFVSLIAGASFITASHSAPAPDEADKCLAGPKGTAPQGSHWYYRVERGTKRHCWYVGEEKEKVARSAPAISSASADPASSIPPPPKNAGTPKAIADARAELPSSQTQTEPGTGVTVQRAAAPAANPAGTNTNQRANDARDTNPQSAAQSSLIASRWPDSSGVSPSASPATAPATEQSAAADQSDAVETPAPAIAPVTLAAADSSTARQTGSIQTLLIVIIGALSLAGLIGSAIFRFSSMRWTGGRDVGGDRRDRREIWDPVSPSPMAYASSDTRMPASAIPREARLAPREMRLVPRETRLTPRETRMIPRETRGEAHAPDDPDQRISEMLARLSRAAAN